jgi:hypothetical protein
MFAMQQLAVFLNRLKSVDELGGNLLDRAAVLCTSDYQLGRTHDNRDFPILLAGRFGGRLRSGIH